MNVKISFLYLLWTTKYEYKSHQKNWLKTSVYLIMMRISEPVSIALKRRESKREAKKSLDQTFPFSAFNSLSVFGIPCKALDWSKIFAASAEDFNWLRRQRWSFSWSASCVSSDSQWIWISFCYKKEKRKLKT